MRRKTVLVIAGLSLVAAGVLAILRRDVSPVQDREFKQPEAKTTITSSWGLPGACASCWGGDRIVILYPTTMRINQSSVVQVSFSSHLWGLGLSKPGALDRPITLSLHGASFGIDPAGDIEKSAGSGSSFAWFWSIAPKSTGSHSLILNLEGFHLRSYGGSPAAAGSQYDSIEVNGTSLDLEGSEELRSQVLEITVLTKEGVSDVAASYIGYLLAAIGAILLYPAVSDRLGRWIGRQPSSVVQAEPIEETQEIRNSLEQSNSDSLDATSNPQLETDQEDPLRVPPGRSA